MEYIKHRNWKGTGESPLKPFVSMVANISCRHHIPPGKVTTNNRGSCVATASSWPSGAVAML